MQMRQDRFLSELVNLLKTHSASTNNKQKEHTANQDDRKNLTIV